MITKETVYTGKQEVAREITDEEILETFPDDSGTLVNQLLRRAQLAEKTIFNILEICEIRDMYHEDIQYYLEKIGYVKCMFCDMNESLDFEQKFHKKESVVSIEDADLGSGYICEICADQQAEIEKDESLSDEEKEILEDAAEKQWEYHNYKFTTMEALGYAHVYLNHSKHADLEFSDQRERLHFHMRQYEQLDRSDCNDLLTWGKFYKEVNDEYENLL